MPIYKEKAKEKDVPTRDSVLLFEALPDTQNHTHGDLVHLAREEMLRGLKGMDPDSLAEHKFPVAAKRWLVTRKRNLKSRTYGLYEHHIEQLSRFFGELTIDKINLGHLREYQSVRSVNYGETWTKAAGPSLINHELSVVQQVLKRAGRWHRIASFYEPLTLPRPKRKKVMTYEEEDRFYSIGESQFSDELGYHVAGISANTTICGSELRHIRFEHILRSPPRFGELWNGDESGAKWRPRLIVDDEHAKNTYRGRVVPLNQTALYHLDWCEKRARSLGSSAPHHHLFPFRVKRGTYDPNRPTSTSWLRNSFKTVREGTGVEFLTPHCLRHQAITEMLENGASPETVRSIAGHVTEKQMRDYCHTRVEAQISVLDKIDPQQRRQRHKKESQRKPPQRVATGNQLGARMLV